MTQSTSTIFLPGQPLNTGYNHICDPDHHPLQHIRFGRIWLPQPGDTWNHSSGENEEVISLLSGSAAVRLPDGQEFVMGPRKDPFSAPPTMLYLPPGTTYSILAGIGGYDAGLSAAKAQPGGQALLLSPEKIKKERHGAGTWGRKVYLGTVGDFPIQRLMVGETFNRPGQWTSYPPHKHDQEKPPQEFPYEEIYFYFLKPKNGFAMQRVYDAPDHPEARDEVFLLRDGDTVLVPHGYHPVVGAPGYQMGYLWIMAGVEGHRTYGQTSVDPDHLWLTQVEPILEND
jgi:5-deoxy-glucuronate isomerase